MDKALHRVRAARRGGLGALMVAIGAMLAFGSLAIGVQTASAHHTEYEASRFCDGSWAASGRYVGGENARLVIVSGVTINGMPFDPAWSNGLLQPYNPGTQGQTNSPVPSPAYAWVGVSEGFPLFNQSGGTFVGGAGNWTGTLYIFGDDDGDGMWEMTRPPVDVYEPDGPTDCEPTPTATTPPCYPPDSGTPPAGAPPCTPTPTATTTTPPCYEPGTTPPAGAPACTPTPTASTPTPTTPPCYPPGTGKPPEGATQCTPTPVNTVAGVKTPGPGVPSAGTGLTTDLSSTNVLFALLGVLALTGGAALLALGRTPADD